MAIFHHKNYRAALKEACAELKARKRALGILKIAEKSSMHGSFLSSVLRENNHLTSDQIYSIGETLDLDIEETEYLDMLMRAERSVSKSLKVHLEGKINELYQNPKKLSSHIKAKPLKNTDNIDDIITYYADPLHSLVRQAVSLASGTNLEDIASEFGLSFKELKKILNQLTKMNLIEKNKNGELTSTNKHMHLDKTDPICRAYQEILKTRCQERQRKNPEKSNQQLMVTFSCETKVRKKIEEECLDFIARVQKIVKTSKKKQEVLQLNLDFFNWV